MTWFRQSDWPNTTQTFSIQASQMPNSQSSLETQTSPEIQRRKEEVIENKNREERAGCEEHDVFEILLKNLHVSHQKSRIFFDIYITLSFANRESARFLENLTDFCCKIEVFPGYLSANQNISGYIESSENGCQNSKKGCQNSKWGCQCSKNQFLMGLKYVGTVSVQKSTQSPIFTARRDA